MPNFAHPIANEFASYLQDRARRLAYGVRQLSHDAAYALPASARLALVEFLEAWPDTSLHGALVHSAMLDHHDRSHFAAWAGQPGALVQVNVYRHEAGRLGHAGEGVAGRIGVRAFAEEFFSDEHGRSLPLDAFRAYLGWLAAATRGANPVALAIRAPHTRELVLVRLPSAAAANDWLRRQA